jgi:acyl-CoA hydrolase/RimJ/RimL family protein N-acetyltransferase
MVIEMSKEDKWCELAKWYKNFGCKEITPEECIKYIKPGQKIYLHSGCSEPQTLSQQLILHHKELKDIEILHFISFSKQQNEILQNLPEDHFRYNAFTIGEQAIRDSINTKHADYTPMYLSEIPKMFKQGKKHVDVALIQVSPPDKNNFCSFGVNVDCSKDIAESADLIIAEVNPNVPRVLGNSFIHMSKIDYFIYSENPLIEVSYPPPDHIHKKIAINAANLIKDGSTIHIGIGKAPYAVMEALFDHKQLGVHSDCIYDPMVDLVEEGVITNELKTSFQGRIAASYAMGTKKLFKFVDDNLGVEFHPCSLINDPFEIAKNDRMTTVNGAIEVDLLGQINAESIGTKFYSGFGGLVDFCRGASMAKEGRSIIVMPSTIRKEEGSRIVPTLRPGSHVSLTMADVDYIVTEFGVAHLKGKNIRERALALISIAHPKYREWLLEEAKKLNYIYSDQKLAKDQHGNMVIIPIEFKKVYLTPKGIPVIFRALTPNDERHVQDLYYRLDEQSVVFRFFTKKKYFSRSDVAGNVIVDYENIFPLGGFIGDIEDQKLIAMCSYERDRATNMGEIAFTVADDWRNQGLTKFMLNTIAKIAAEKGLDGFKGEIMFENKAMIHIIQKSGYKVKGSLEGDNWYFSFRFEDRIEK